MRKKWLIGLFILCISSLSAEVRVTISDPLTWTTQNLAAYVGLTVAFDQPLYVVSSTSCVVSPRHHFYYTNQARPGSSGASDVTYLLSRGDMTLSGTGSHRLGEWVNNLVATVNSATSLSYISGEWSGNSRAQLTDSVPTVDIVGKHRILVCAMNLEYYLVNFNGISNNYVGPSSSAEHQKQRAKISAALARINADLYGLVEVQKGNEALQEIAEDLTSNTGRQFTYISEGGSSSGTYTKSGIVYCSDVLEPASALQSIDVGVSDRKKMIVFKEISTGERFIYSLNHFKAKSGTGSGADADQGDGQSAFNATRVKEANAVISKYTKFHMAVADPDILIMGDLNAYGKEDPVIVLTSNGMTDLHRAFHGDMSYSYRYQNKVGYLDHALCNATLYPQITGMIAYHINSDESDSYTYDKSSDRTMFRSSDHDPILVGLALDSTLNLASGVAINSMDIWNGAEHVIVNNAHQNTKENSYYQIYTIDGMLLEQQAITSTHQTYEVPPQSGLYIILIYDGGVVQKYKIIVP